MTTYDILNGELSTPRLRLRRLRASDTSLIALYSGDARIARMTTRIPHPYPPGTAEAFVNRQLAPGASERVWVMDAGEEDENGLIGLIGLKAETEGVAEVGFWVAPAFWGTGFASEAVEAVVDAARISGLRAVTAEAFHDNGASIRVLTRAGFEYVGDGEAFSVARAGTVPVHRYRRVLAAE